MLEKINSPADLKKLKIEDLEFLADEIRDLIVNTVSKTGGHLASSLGTVELILALHYVFSTPSDKIIWDVGHQAYAHKIVTGRRDSFATLRQYDGISGFPARQESEHDIFGTGHSSTSISAALGFAKARDLKNQDYDVLAVIGDGALTGGMALEALNHSGHLEADMIVVLNDNEMSISKNVGAIASYLSKVRMQPHFIKARSNLQQIVKNIPKIGKKLFKTARDIESHLTYLVVPGVLFESMGYTYLGPFDGHDMELLVSVFNKVKDMKGPRIIHVVTQKGKGYVPAEENATKFHGAVPFNIETGLSDSSADIPTYTKIFGKTLIELAYDNSKIVAVTAAMPDGTGLVEFAEKFPKRFFDAGIAEQHAVTFSAALACNGLRPVVAVYSTFLQRAVDQLIHDVCLQNLPVTFAIDRAGIVGDDGVTHQGAFDLSYLRFIPNIVIMAPKDESELRDMLYTALKHEGPSAIRYPRGQGIGVKIDRHFKEIPLGKAEVLKEGEDVLFLAIGNMVYPSLLAAENLKALGLEAAVVNLRYLKPLDEELILKLCKKIKKVITLEENTLIGALGAAVLELLASRNCKDIEVKNIGLPDKFIEHGHPSILREKYHLTSGAILEAVKTAFQMVG